MIHRKANSHGREAENHGSFRNERDGFVAGTAGLPREAHPAFFAS